MIGMPANSPADDQTGCLKNKQNALVADHLAIGTGERTLLRLTNFLNAITD
jgi:hypothetical protein